MTSPVGETQLHTLLTSLEPHLDPAVYVFCAVPTEQAVPIGILPLCQFWEAEGLTLILKQTEAEQAGLPYQFPCRRIVLTVHSSLTAVGMLAAIARPLAAAGISVNVISAYYHDHLFVPHDQADAAIASLRRLMRHPDVV